MKKYLLDTNIVSELRKLKPHRAVVSWVGGLREEQIFLSSVTMGELQSGAELTRRQDTKKATEIEIRIDQLQATRQVLAMDSECFREWGRLTQRKSDHLLDDGMIAATARVHGLVVATRNENDFQPFDVPTFNPFR